MNQSIQGAFEIFPGANHPFASPYGPHGVNSYIHIGWIYIYISGQEFILLKKKEQTAQSFPQ